MTRRTLEHQRFLVDNAQETARLFQELFGWDIRWEGIVLGQSYVIHMDAREPGGSERYVTISDRGPMLSDEDAEAGAQSLGVVVDDLDATARRARTLGLELYDCGRLPADDRLCFEDTNGIAVRVKGA